MQKNEQGLKADITYRMGSTEEELDRHECEMMLIYGDDNVKSNKQRSEMAMTSTLRNGMLLSSLLLQVYGEPACGAGSESVMNRVRGKTGVTESIGYKAAESPFAPSRSLRTPPLLPQSALLNSLPVKNKLIAELQAYLESFLLLINPNPLQEAQISRNDSALWTNLRINAQRAAGMFIYNRQQLEPTVGGVNETKAIKALRQAYGQSYLDYMRKDVLLLVRASAKSSVPESVRWMRYALNNLCNVAYLQVEKENCQASVRAAAQEAAASGFGNVNVWEDGSIKTVENGMILPVLEGRATVVLRFRRPGSRPILKLARRKSPSGKSIVDNLGRTISGTVKDDSVSKNDVFVKLVVDGINHPLAAGTFLDLCKKGFYDNTPCFFDSYEIEGNPDKPIPRKVLGSKEKTIRKYMDPVKKRPRVIPIEVLREKSTNQFGRYTAIGSARNSAVFTQDANSVLSFATYGAIGMYHDDLDSNSGGSAFFSVPFDQSLSVYQRSQLPTMAKMNNKFSLFAFVVDGNDVLVNLKEGDLLVDTKIEAGLFALR